jgi:ABC-type multidrug transport system fused ATPase/permease subunit
MVVENGVSGGSRSRFWTYLRPYRGTLVLSTVIGVLKYNLPVVFPWLLKDLIDNLVGGRPGALGLGLDGLMGLALMVFVVYAVITHLRTYIADRLSQRMMLDIRTDLYRHLQSLPVDYFHAHQTGAIATRLVTDVSMAQNYVGLVGTNVFMDVTSFVAIAAVMLHLDWKLALVAFSTLPLYAFLNQKLGRRMTVASREMRRRMSLLEGSLHESIAGIAEIKSFTHEEERARGFAHHCQDLLGSAYDQIRLYALNLGSAAFLTRVPLVLVIWVGARAVLRGELSVGALMAFYAYQEMVYRPLDRLSELNVLLANSRAAIQRLLEFLELAPEENGAAPGRQLVVERGAIEYRGVVFGYTPERPVLHGLDLVLAPGERVALVGRSGAGKSTLVKLLLRFHTPQAGEIRIDGQPIAAVGLRSLRSQISIVHQDLLLFSGSVADNVRVGKAGATSEEILDALARAHAREFVEALPHGLDTEIGERGVRLSGGQKQRLAIARAFLKNAPLLILDESTSNLDSAAEEQVYDALEHLMAGRTTLIIAHRLSTVRRADRIVVLDQGAVVEHGRHAELLAREGLYSRLYRSGTERLALEEA